MIDKNLDFAAKVIPGERGRKYAKHISPSASSGNQFFLEAGIAASPSTASASVPTATKILTTKRLMSVDEIGHANSEQYLHQKHLSNYANSEMVFETSIAKTKLVKSQEDFLGRSARDQEVRSRSSKKFKRMRSWMSAVKHRASSKHRNPSSSPAPKAKGQQNEGCTAGQHEGHVSETSTPAKKKKSLFSKVAKVTKVNRVLHAFKSNKKNYQDYHHTHGRGHDLDPRSSNRPEVALASNGNSHGPSHQVIENSGHSPKHLFTSLSKCNQQLFSKVNLAALHA